MLCFKFRQDPRAPRQVDDDLRDPFRLLLVNQMPAGGEGEPIDLK